ncbi:MAG: PD40 domain-containing protein, partial [Ignavibacterium sp.]
MRRILAVFISLSILPCLVLGSSQDSTKTDTTKASPRPAKRALPLKADRAITFETSEVTWMSLDVSPDGKTIVFDLLGDLYVVSVNGGKAERISGGMAFDAQPRFSPDGKRVVFTSDRGGSENVWIMTVSMPINDTTAAADSTGLKQLTKGKNAAFYSPEWTPDGNYIVASKIEGLGVNKLWLYHSEGGSGIELMSKEKTWNLIGAAFGPDNRWIYVSRKNGRWEYNMNTFGFQIGVYDRESGEFYPLTNHTGGGVRPAVSPDGTWLVYGSRHDAKTGYRIRNLSTGQEEWLLYPVQRDDQESRFTRDML